MKRTHASIGSLGPSTETSGKSSIHWFRKGLRLHDNPALLASIEFAKTRGGAVFPVFCLDVGYYVSPVVVGPNRMAFLLECLRDLHQSLRQRGSRLFVLRGDPTVLLPACASRWGVGHLSFEADFEPYARTRDARVTSEMCVAGLVVQSFSSHTLYDPDLVRTKLDGGQAFPKTYRSFLKLLQALGAPDRPVEAPESVPSGEHPPSCSSDEFRVPGLDEIGYSGAPTTTLFCGGETKALERMRTKLRDVEFIRSFSKPATSPCSLVPSTTLLSPHLKFGALSPRLFFHSLCDTLSVSHMPVHPPESLLGQLSWREFFTMSSIFVPNFDRIQGNPICRQIIWDAPDPALLQRWKEGRTGFPWIDSLMRQLAKEGWMHHLGRHCVACFLTRGDLWQSWEEGKRWFDVALVDADWALNAANWMWVSCSAFFHQFSRVYSPTAFPKKYPDSPDFIRHWVPELRSFPTCHIFEPWLAPLSVQRASHCIIGVEYPAPMVDHAAVMATNKTKLAQFFPSNETTTKQTTTSS
ncbi:MAG: FAD-binding domain-containing protein [archaeon]|nr:FAD-binding domain-containing protein [archaeon]